MKQFEEKQAQVLGLSCDPATGLKVWAAAMGGIGYPLLADFFPHGAVSSALGIFNAEGGFTKRAVVIVDPKGIVRAVNVSPPGVLPVPSEVLTELTGLQGK